MTGNTLEQRARELLAAEYEREGLRNGVDGSVYAADRAALRAIEAALRLSAGADWPTFAGIAIIENKALPPGVWALASKADLDRALAEIVVPKMSPLKQDLFKAGTHAVIRAFNDVIAAAPRHETGEG